MNSFKTQKGTELPIMLLKGKEYLQVAYRLVWFREERPLWSIETSFELLTEKAAIAKACIKDEAGRILATAHKQETAASFADHIEKAETGAIGRALALVGFGTQFTDDLDGGERLADTPLPRMSYAINPKLPVHVGVALGQANAYTDQTSGSYVVPFGKFKGFTLDQVNKELGSKEIENYISYIENLAIEKGESVKGAAAEFIRYAEKFLGNLEKSSAKDLGSRV